MKTSESKGRFFLQNESIHITNRIDSNRELECSSMDAPEKLHLANQTLAFCRLRQSLWRRGYGDAAATRIRVLLLHISLPVSSCGHWCIEEGVVGVNPPSHRLDQRKFFHRVIWPTLCTGSRYKHHQFNHSCD